MGMEQASPGPRRDPRFPPLVRFKVFLDMTQKLAAAPGAQREARLAELPENDRSQLLRAMALFGLRSEDGRYDEIGLRRLASSEHRAHALRDLIEMHYAPELATIQEGVDR